MATLLQKILKKWSITAESFLIKKETCTCFCENWTTKVNTINCQLFQNKL